MLVSTSFWSASTALPLRYLDPRLSDISHSSLFFSYAYSLKASTLSTLALFWSNSLADVQIGYQILLYFVGSSLSYIAADLKIGCKYSTAKFVLGSSHHRHRWLLARNCKHFDGCCHPSLRWVHYRSGRSTIRCPPGKPFSMYWQHRSRNCALTCS